MDPNKFIDNLVSDLKPTKPLRPPWIRSLVWFFLVATITAGIMYGVQEYRPGFQDQLREYGRLQVEIGSGIIWTLLTFYIIFASSIPGTKIHGGLKIACLASFFIFTGSLISGFWIAAPESSKLGARAACEMEVFMYGGLTMGGLLYLVRNGILAPYSGNHLLIGCSGGMVSAVIMQLACMYDPWHGLIFHFGPALLLGVAGWLLSDRIKSFMDQKSKLAVQPKQP